MIPFKVGFISATLAIVCSTSGSGQAENIQDESDCYDAVVKAKITRQTPSVITDCGPDCIVMVWPWFVQLNVERVFVGNAARGPDEVLTMQHTSFLTKLGPRRWWLRRNALGGFNLLKFAKSEGLPKCRADQQAAEPYIEPGPGQTLNELRRDAERVYQRGS